jgi:DNA-binding response OmpR family regulator
MSQLKVLLADDDRNLGMILKAFLDAKGHKATLCTSGEDAWKSLADNYYDICVFDVRMPGMDGFTLARRVKEVQPDMPLVFLTACDELEDILEGFAIGADDYVTKPFHMEELEARLKAICRRYVAAPSKPMEFRLGSFVFNAPRHVLIDHKGEERKLTSKESDLLLMLCENRGNTLERTNALQAIWKEVTHTSARSMDVYITKLRKYFADDPNVNIANVHGVGFRLDVNK